MSFKQYLLVMLLISATGITNILQSVSINKQQTQIEILTERVILLEETIAETGGIKLEMPK